ncbi:hypothetical protein VFPBJ_04170 [Purpureocillium lilacinum]|uniref:Uncharacterized protein n=1 Tax=Purpureocillium lilacinum TaxID=33203 RepID=A0A179GUF4_PURLI|nr:hypothetical protein VFPBJ_04170 [Purpureocillium lilacinum]
MGSVLHYIKAPMLASSTALPRYTSCAGCLVRPSPALPLAPQSSSLSLGLSELVPELPWDQLSYSHHSGAGTVTAKYVHKDSVMVRPAAGVVGWSGTCVSDIRYSCAAVQSPSASSFFLATFLLFGCFEHRDRSHSGRSPLDKLVQVLHRCDAEHEAPILVGDDGKLLLPLAAGDAAAEEVLEVLEGRVHGDDAVGAAAALEARHGGAEGVVGLDAAGVEERLQVRDGDVAEEGARLRVDDGEVRVVALKGGEEGEGNGVGGVEGEGGGGVEVLDGGLFPSPCQQPGGSFIPSSHASGMFHSQRVEEG